MSGHNKWSKIKNKKAVEDQKKSKTFSILSKMIALESKKSNGDKNSPGLRSVIERARGLNMPGDNIEKAIKKGVGLESTDFEEVVYEAYGPGGVAIIIEGITDKKTRTTPEIKHILSKYNLSIANLGSVLWAFKREDNEWKAINKTNLEGEQLNTLKSLVEDLNNHDDIKSVFVNTDL